MSKGKGCGGKSRRGKFRVKSRVSWMGEGTEEELSCVMGHEASGVSRFVAKRMDVECEGRIGQKGVAKGMGGGDGGFKGMKNMLGGQIGVCMDVGGIVLHKGFLGAEGREMKGKCTASAMTGPEMVFEVGGKRDGPIKGKAVGTGALHGGSGREVMTSAKGAARVGTGKEAGG